MRLCLFFLVVMLSATACTTSQKAGKEKPYSRMSAPEKLHDLFRQEKDFSRETTWFFNVQPAWQAKRMVYWQSLVERLDQINLLDLSSQDQINHQIFRFVLNDKIKRIEFEEYLMPFNAEGGFFTELTFGQRRFRFEKHRDFQNYLEMLHAYKGYLESNMQNMRIGLEKGITQPKLIAQGYRALIEPYLNTTAEQSFFYAPFHNIPDNISELGKTELQEAARAVIIDSILTVYQTFDRFMQEEYLPGCRESLGISALPGGKAYYEYLVNYYTTLQMEPEEIYQLGEKEVARIETEMQATIAETGFTGTLPEFLDFLRKDPQFYAATPEELLSHAAYLSKQIDGLLPNYFYRLPRLPYGVQPVPEDIAPNYTSGRYSPGSVDAHRAGNYWVNTYKLESRPLYVLPALTLHEAVPGHHLQISLAQEMENTPDFRRDLYLSSYGEGWALYCEWLGIEMGIYKTPYERFGRLSYEMWRACRLVIDVGLHAKGWTRQQAVDYMASRTSLSLHEVNTEIDRYIGWPGQALSYKIGELKIRELRARTANALGPQFDLREFHDLILENGSVPLFLLEQAVDEYIEANKN